MLIMLWPQSPKDTSFIDFLLLLVCITRGVYLQRILNIAAYTQFAVLGMYAISKLVCSMGNPGCGSVALWHE